MSKSSYASERYSPTDGKKHRKYHLDPAKINICKEKWEEEVSLLDTSIREQVHSHFFNPYRKGMYYYQVQSLFLLGGNEWHSLSSIIKELSSYMSGITVPHSQSRTLRPITAWEQFKSKKSRIGAYSPLDYIGRIQENFMMLQRFLGSHPYGYKLHQVCAALDFKKVDSDILPRGECFYRLSTYDCIKDSVPIRDFREYSFRGTSKAKHLNNKFCGIILI